MTAKEKPKIALPKGWTGNFAVAEGGVRKIWVTYMGGKK